MKEFGKSNSKKLLGDKEKGRIAAEKLRAHEKEVAKARRKKLVERLRLANLTFRKHQTQDGRLGLESLFSERRRIRK